MPCSSSVKKIGDKSKKSFEIKKYFTKSLSLRFDFLNEANDGTYQKQPLLPACREDIDDISSIYAVPDGIFLV